MTLNFGSGVPTVVYSWSEFPGIRRLSVMDTDGYEFYKQVTTSKSISTHGTFGWTIFGFVSCTFRSFSDDYDLPSLSGALQLVPPNEKWHNIEFQNTKILSSGTDVGEAYWKRGCFEKIWKFETTYSQSWTFGGDLSAASLGSLGLDFSLSSSIKISATFKTPVDKVVALWEYPILKNYNVLENSWTFDGRVAKRSLGQIYLRTKTVDMKSFGPCIQ